MSTIEQRRAWVLTKVMAGEIEVAEAAEPRPLGLLGLAPETAVRRGRPGRARPRQPGRSLPRRIDESTRDQVRVLARGRYDGANDSHLAELLAEHEAITISRVGVRRIPAGGRHRQPAPAPSTAPTQPTRPDAPGGHAPPYQNVSSGSPDRDRVIELDPGRSRPGRAEAGRGPRRRDEARPAHLP